MCQGVGLAGARSGDDEERHRRRRLLLPDAMLNGSSLFGIEGLKIGDGHRCVLKVSVVDAELAKLDLKLRTVRRATRMVSPTAYEAGGAAGASLAINPGIRRT